MKLFKTRFSPILQVTILAAAAVLLFQNCGQKLSFSKVENNQSSLGACNGVSCDLTPLTSQPAVTTILLALGDTANKELVINGASSQLIAETVVRYSTPVANPKILVVQDSNNHGETPEDLGYVTGTLLSRYQVTEMNEPVGGLKTSDVAGYDLVWWNNPGHPMGSSKSRDTLLAFAGGVILQGDDLTQGAGFDLQELTGLKYIDNGASITCGSHTYNTDNNQGIQYSVTLDASKFTGVVDSEVKFSYGNDLDNSEPARKDLEILATAKGSPDDCTVDRPAIVRYFKAAPSTL